MEELIWFKIVELLRSLKIHPTHFALVAAACDGFQLIPDFGHVLVHQLLLQLLDVGLLSTPTDRLLDPFAPCSSSHSFCS